jgi:hypothetical protein
MKHQSETKPISADGNRLFFRRLASWQALAAARKSAQATIAPETIEPAATVALFPAKFWARLEIEILKLGRKSN